MRRVLGCGGHCDCRRSGAVDLVHGVVVEDEFAVVVLLKWCCRPRSGLRHVRLCLSIDAVGRWAVGIVSWKNMDSYFITGRESVFFLPWPC